MTSAEVPIRERRRGLARLSQFIDYFFWLLYTLLILRLILVFLNARSGTGFVEFINGVTNPFYAPFRGIVRTSTVEVQGDSTLAWPIVIALVAYAILHLAINRLLRVMAYRRVAV